MLNNIDAVIFDMDGTLIDSMWMWKEIDIEYLRRFSIPFPEDLQEIIEGMSFAETAIYFKERFKLEDSLEQIKSDWIEMAWQYYYNDVTIKPGVEEFLKYLKSQNIPTGIATSNSRVLTDMIIERLNMKEYFNTVRTSCEAAKGKPSPDIYLLVAKDLNVDPVRCLVFEDVIQGIMAGKNANMKVCAVYDEFSEKDHKQKKRLADYYVHSMDEILKIK